MMPKSSPDKFIYLVDILCTPIVKVCEALMGARAVYNVTGRGNNWSRSLNGAGRKVMLSNSYED